MADNKRKGPLEGPIKRILESQDRMEANVAAIRATTAAMQRWADAITASAPKTFLARLFWRLGL